MMAPILCLCCSPQFCNPRPYFQQHPRAFWNPIRVLRRRTPRETEGKRNTQRETLSGGRYLNTRHLNLRIRNFLFHLQKRSSMHCLELLLNCSIQFLKMVCSTVRAVPHSSVCLEMLSGKDSHRGKRCTQSWLVAFVCSSLFTYS